MYDYRHGLEWANKQLIQNQGLTILNTEEIELKSYSIVCKIETNKGVFYFKQTPEELLLEPDTLDFLNSKGGKNIPKCVAKNAALQCFLMTSCGDVTLRNLLDGKADLPQLAQGIQKFTTIQRTLENSIPQMLDLGLPDWRLDKFPALYHDLLSQEQLLVDDGLTQEELEQLRKLESQCATLCKELADFGIPETINHCDFHENNMVLDKNTGEINLIDWGEAIISHPFLSLCGCLWNLTFFQDIKIDDERYHQVELYCIEAWADQYDKDSLLKALRTANRINGIFAALGFERMYRATKGLEGSVQKMHPGSVAGCLRTFLKAIQS